MFHKVIPIENKETRCRKIKDLGNKRALASSGDLMRPLRREAFVLFRNPPEKEKCHIRLLIRETTSRKHVEKFWENNGKNKHVSYFDINLAFDNR